MARCVPPFFLTAGAIGLFTSATVAASEGEITKEIALRAVVGFRESDPKSVDALGYVILITFVENDKKRAIYDHAEGGRILIGERAIAATEIHFARRVYGGKPALLFAPRRQYYKGRLPFAGEFANCADYVKIVHPDARLISEEAVRPHGPGKRAVFSFQARFFGGSKTRVLSELIMFPQLDAEKPTIDGIRVDTLREMIANKLTTLLSRTEVKDVVDLYFIEHAGHDLLAALPDARFCCMS